MTSYRIQHVTHYVYGQTAPNSQNQVRLRPRLLDYQHVRGFTLSVSPTPRWQGKRRDFFGNEVDYFGLYDPHLGLKVASSFEVELSDRTHPAASDSPPWNEVVTQVNGDLSASGLAVQRFKFDSRFAFADPNAQAYAKDTFAPGRPVLDAAIDLMHRIHRDFVYDPRATTIQTPLEELYRNRRGVCQDFAHVAIATLRAQHIPARYVSGYLRTLPPPGQPPLVGADASHAWFSVYCGDDQWVDLDPTNDVVVGSDHITIAWGRDYGDVCPIEGVFTGGGAHSMSVSVDVRPL